MYSTLHSVDIEYTINVRVGTIYSFHCCYYLCTQTFTFIIGFSLYLDFRRLALVQNELCLILDS